MAIHVGWDNEVDCVIRWDLDSTYSMEDLWFAFDKTVKLVEQAGDSPRLDMLLSAPEVLRPPKGLLGGLMSITQKASGRRDGPELIVMCSESYFARGIMQTVSKLACNDNWVIVSTLDLGRKCINRSREAARTALPVPENLSADSGRDIFA
jgi:hypothetical protein